jgi:hypothetical protein
MLKQIAQKYNQELNWTCIPVRGKTPSLISWETLTTETCKNYLDKYETNIGVVCGEASGIIVLDLDPSQPKDEPKKRDGVKKYNQLCEQYGTINTVIARTGGGGLHIFFKYTERVKHWMNSVCFYKDNDDIFKWDLKTNKGQIVISPSIHVNTKLQYEWINSPFEFDILEVPNWLFYLIDKYLGRKSSSSKIKTAIESLLENIDVDSIKPDIEPVDNDFKEISDLLGLIKSERSDNYDDWVKFSMIIKFYFNKNGKKECYKNLWDKFSQKGLKYNRVNNLKMWETFKPRAEQNTLEGVTIATLREWAREDNLEIFTEMFGNQLITKTICKNLFRSQEGHADIFAEYYKNEIYTVDSKGNGYIFNHDSKLWIKSDSGKIQNLIPPLLEKIIIKYRAFLTDKQTTNIDKNEKEKLEKSINELTKMLKVILTNKHARDVFSLVKTKIFNEEITSFLNVEKHLLPIKGGKCVNLKTGEVVPRKKYHYFSFECDV